MKRRTHPMQKTGISPYARYSKREYLYPEWVKDKRKPVPQSVLDRTEPRPVFREAA